MPTPKEVQTPSPQKVFDDLLEDTCEELQSAALDILLEEQEALEDTTRDDEW